MAQNDFSLWSIQQALTALIDLGLVHGETVGRATLHTFNHEHYAARPLEALLSPLAALRTVVRETVGTDVHAVVLFGSLARGESSPGSDIDLAVIAPAEWDRRGEVQEAVQTRMGNRCDVLVFSPTEFLGHARSKDEPVVNDILSDGIVLAGALPQHDVEVA